jgi:hypothetical protein
VANEFWDSTYKCSADELSPPPTIANFNAPYPVGFAGNQACGITSGTNYAVDQFDVWNYSWIKWVFLAVICCYWLIWTTLALLALIFVRYLSSFDRARTQHAHSLTLSPCTSIRHTPPPPPRMQEKERKDSQELADFNIQTVKKEAAEKYLQKKGTLPRH